MFYNLFNVKCVDLIKRMQVQVDMRSLSSVESLAWFCESTLDDYVKVQLTGLTPEDIIAREFWYHRSFQRSINRTEREYQEHCLREECFQELVPFVKETLIQERKLTTISNLARKHRELQTKRTIEIKGIYHKDVKRRLKLQFLDNLTFYQKSKRKSEYVYGKSMPIEEDEQSWFFMSLRGKLEKAAQILREEVENFPSPFQEWPPHPDVLYDQTIASQCRYAAIFPTDTSFQKEN